MENNIIVEIDIDSTAQTTGVSEKLDQLRRDIDVIDGDIIQLIVKRFAVIEKMHEEKKKHSMSIVQISRREEILNDKIQQAKSAGVSTELIIEVWNALHKYSILHQQHMQTA